MNDLISRQSVIDALDEQFWRCLNIPICKEIRNVAKETIKALPSAQTEKMRGRWQEITESDCSGYDPVLAGYDDPVIGYVCSACHEGYEKEVMGDVAWNYCPNCGAKMRG